MTAVWMGSLLALWLFTLVLAFLLIGALRQIGIINLRLGPDQGALLITNVGLDRGAQAPNIVAVDALTDAVVNLADLPARPRVLTFVSPTCMSCHAVLRGLKDVIATRKDEIEFVAICQGQHEACVGMRDVAGVEVQMLLDPTAEISEQYGVSMTPFVYFIDGSQRVLMRGVANDWRGIESLLAEEGTLQTGEWSEMSDDRVEGKGAVRS